MYFQRKRETIMATAPLVLVLMAILAVYSAAYVEDVSSIEIKPRAPRGSGSLCGRVISRGPTAAEKKEIVDLHNKLRNLVASGQEKRGRPGPQPPTNNMKPMQWSDELAQTAQAWANHCETWKHDPNLNRSVGQNMGYETPPGRNRIPVSTIITSWYDEVDNFNGNGVKSFRADRQSPMFLHYTQVVWGETNQVGCGLIRYNERPQQETAFLVCNYFPRGNMIGDRVY